MHETQLVCCFGRVLPFWGACVNSRGEGGVYCPLQPVEDDCSFHPLPCHRKLGVERSCHLENEAVEFQAHFCFSPLPLVMLCFLDQRTEVPTCLLQFSSVQSLSRVRLFATPWIAARQASLSITNSWSSLKLRSIELVGRQANTCHLLSKF